MPGPLDELCVKILKFDKRRIRYAAVLDRYGKVLAGGMKRGVTSLEPGSQELRLMAHISSQVNSNASWDPYFGRTIYTFTRRENVNIMLFEERGKLVMVSTEPEFPLAMVEQVRDLIVNRSW